MKEERRFQQEEAEPGKVLVQLIYGTKEMNVDITQIFRNQPVDSGSRIKYDSSLESSLYLKKFKSVKPIYITFF